MAKKQHYIPSKCSRGAQPHTTDETWLALLDEGLTSKQAAKRLGVCTVTCQRNARRLGRQWHNPTPEINRTREQTPEERAKRRAALLASNFDRTGSFRNHGLDKLSPEELETYRFLRKRKRMPRVESAQIIGRLDIIRPDEVEKIIGRRMLAAHPKRIKA